MAAIAMALYISPKTTKKKNSKHMPASQTARTWTIVLSITVIR
jgi:hypothetical protein